MYGKKDVTHTRPTKSPRGVSSPSHDQHVFSATAGMTHKVNVMQGRPMRGGIRL